MHPTIIGAIIIALGVLVAAGMPNGNFQIAADGGVAYRVNTRTGTISACRVIDRTMETNCSPPAR